MVRGGATLNFSRQICQAEIDSIKKISRRARVKCVYIAVDAADKNM